MESDVARAAQAFIAHSGFVRGLALRHAPLPGVTDDVVQQVLVEFLARASEWDLSEDIRPLVGCQSCLAG